MIGALKPHLILADDHVLLDQAADKYLSAMGHFEVAAAGTVRRLLDSVATCSVGLIMLDAQMQGMRGLGTILKIFEKDFNGRIML